MLESASEPILAQPPPNFDWIRMPFSLAGFGVLALHALAFALHRPSSCAVNPIGLQ